MFVKVSKDQSEIKDSQKLDLSKLLCLYLSVGETLVSRNFQSPDFKHWFSKTTLRLGGGGGH